MSLNPAQVARNCPAASCMYTPCTSTTQEKRPLNGGQCHAKKDGVKPNLATQEPSVAELSFTPTSSQAKSVVEKAAVPRKKLPSYPYEDMSTRLHIIVGDDKEFQVQRELLCKHSDLFKDICSEFASYEQPIRLIHADKDTFASFVGYIHDEDIHLATGIPTSIHQKSDGPTHAKRQSSFLHLSKCHILGWDLRAYGFCNDVMDVLVEFSKKGHNLRFIAGGTEEIREYVASQANNTPIHELLDDNYVGFARCGTRLEDFTKMADPKEMEDFFRVLEGISKSEMLDKDNKLKFPWERHFCYYHTHPGREEGYLCAEKNIESKAKRVTKMRIKDEDEGESKLDLQG